MRFEDVVSEKERSFSRRTYFHLCIFRTYCAYNINWSKDLWKIFLILPFDWEIQEGSMGSGGRRIFLFGGAEVELVGLISMAVEEEDGFRCGIVDSNYFRCLTNILFTSLINIFSSRTRLRRWNFFCWVILLYL